MGTEILTWMLVIEQSGNRGMGESVPRSEAEVIRRIPSTRVALLLEGNPQRRLEPPPPSPPPSATAAPVPPSHLSPPPSPLSPPPSPLPLSHHTTTPSAVRGRRRLAVSAGPSPALACTGDVPAAPFGAFLPAATRRRPWPPSARRAPPRPLLLLLALLPPPCLVLLPSFGYGPGRTTSPTPLSPPPPLRRVFLPLVSARLTAVTAHTAGVR
jgi:hypothetical protein